VKNKEKIIVALDVPTAAEAREIITELRAEVGAFKIGLQLFTAAGASFVREIVERRHGVKLFLDLKFHDIPNTVAKAAAEAARLGVWMFNVHALGGSEMLRRTVGEVGEICERENLPRPKIIGVTVLTSADEKTLGEIGVEMKVETEVLRLTRLAAKCGLDGVVASPRETRLIREDVGIDNFLIVTPGVRPTDAAATAAATTTTTTATTTISTTADLIGTNDDQKRVMTPGEAIRAGADYLVIGRPILQAESRIEAVRKILGEMEADES
jgi:orotidine-5'-phosphate decarboxylase